MSKATSLNLDRRNFMKGAAAAGLLRAVGISSVPEPPAAAAQQTATAQSRPWHFHLEEATIADVHRAFLEKQLTAVQLVQLYLKRIEAYNGVCVKGAIDPATGLQIGDVSPIENTGQINALITLNVRGKRSKTDTVDNDPSMPDATETARFLDAHLAKTGKLIGPLHGIPMAVKDMFDTRDMRSTSGAAARYANDRPPRDSEVVGRLRAAGAIILAKANMGEYAGGDRSTFGGTTCNPYDTTRSAGRSSGGSGAATAANLVMCAIGEETGDSVRNPAANDNLAGIAPTFGLVSRSGLIPFSLALDRPGVLARKVKDAATVLGAIAGYDPKDPATAESYDRVSRESYSISAERPTLTGTRIGVVREFMERVNQADDDSIRVAEDGLADLARMGATLVDPGPKGQLFADAIREIVTALDSGSLIASFKNSFPEERRVERLIEISTKKAPMPADATLPWYLDNAFPAEEGSYSEETQFLMNRYLQERADATITDIKSLIANSTFFYQAPIDHVETSPKTTKESDLIRKETLKRKDNGASVIVETPVPNPDISGTLARRAVLRALVFKVMADNKLDALVYPMKTIPAPILAEPLEPQNLETVAETSTLTIDGMEYVKTKQRALKERAPLGHYLSTYGGLPAVIVPAGFTEQVYDRAAIVGKDGSKRAGELMDPKSIALPVGLEFTGRPFTEPALIRIAAAYESATHHRRPPKSFGPIPNELEGYLFN